MKYPQQRQISFAALLYMAWGPTQLFMQSVPLPTVIPVLSFNHCPPTPTYTIMASCPDMSNSNSNSVIVHLVLEVHTDSHQVNIILVHEFNICGSEHHAL